MPKPPSDRRFRFYGPILDALRELGGSAKPKEVEEIVFQRCHISEEELAKTNKNGGSNVRNEFHWARDYLRRLGLLDGPESGVWRLTEAGSKTTLTTEEARTLRISPLTPTTPHSQAILQNGGEPEAVTGEDSSDDVPPPLTLLETIKGLPPAGFEKLCQRILREAGFIAVKVTGQSGDGGIDGHGVLQMNELVSFRVVFQCKRYAGSVGPGMVRDFRGGIGTGTDKAILLSTGTYTKSAREEASKPGLFPIELVDGERLVELMERLRLGVTPRTVFDVDERFFDEYRESVVKPRPTAIRSDPQSQAVDEEAAESSTDTENNTPISSTGRPFELTISQHTELLHRYREGETADRLAFEYNVRLNTVYDYLKRLLPDDHRRLKERDSEGATDAELAEEFEITAKRVAWHRSRSVRTS